MAPSIAAVTTTVLSLAAAAVSCHAFSTPSTTTTTSSSAILLPRSTIIQHQSALSMAKGGGGGGGASTNNEKKQGNNQKKRRFLQQAHPIPPPSPPPQQQSSSSTNLASLTGNKSGNINGSTQPTAGTTTTASNTAAARAAAAASKKSNKVRVSPPLQTSKSIEELEAILERRWGTAANENKGGSKKEKGDYEDADFVLSFGSDDDEFETMGSKSSGRIGGGGSGVGGGLKGAAVFRANRVMDPWAKEEGIYDDVKNNSSEDDDSAAAAAALDKKRLLADKGKAKQKQQQRYNRQEAMLNRVRSNQERLQVTKQRQGDGRKKENFSSSGGDDSNNTYNVPVDISKDYYDEDDEGYEGRINGDQRGRKSSLISPKPVGGKGSFSKSSSSSSSSSLSGGIFSDRSMDNSNPASNKKGDRRFQELGDSAKDRPKKRKEPQLKPVLDEDGNEMYLTLEQADIFVQSILSSTSSSVDGRSASEDDDVDGIINSQWEDIGITDTTLLTNLQSTQMSCVTPLAVQDKACPPIVAGNDVLISTHTGSGKTLAFLAPIAQSLLINKNENGGGSGGSVPKAIVVAPGRELASQIVSVAQTLFAGTGLTVSMAIGGTPYSRNVDKLRKRKPDLVVGTPGRIAELIIGRAGDKGGKLKISGLQTIVLDEFDALLQYDSHKEPTMAIMQALDRQHGRNLQRVLCSATAADMMMTTPTSNKQQRVDPNVSSGGPNMIEEYLKPGYAHASVDDSDLLVTSGIHQTKGATTLARVSKTTIHGALHVPHQRLALEAVRKILNTDPLPQQVLIFVDSPRRVDIVIEKLAKMDIIAAPLAGGNSNTKGDRAQVNKALREGYVGIVVATEMAARGIDAPYLTHVINLDLPTDASHYAHRAGRCGRGGRPGVAVSITCDRRERGVPHRFAEELGVDMYNVEARGGKLRIVEG